MENKEICLRVKNLFGILLMLVSIIAEFSLCAKQVYSESEATVESHSLIVASNEGLVNLVYNPSSHTYEKQAEVALSGIIGIIKCGNYYFVNRGEEIFRLDEKLDKSISKKFEKISVLAADDKNIFISAGQCFIALDKDLKELSRVNLELNGYSKDAHDILIYSDIAYLLDNVMLTTFILRVDIKDPRNIRIMEKIRIAEDVWPQLEGQWLNPSLNQWIVLQSYSHKAGGGIKAHIYPMDKGTEKLASQDIYSALAYPTVKEEGCRNRTITRIPPIWAVILDNQGKNYLAQVNSDNNKVSFQNRLDLDELNTSNTLTPEPKTHSSKIVIKQRDSYLFLAFTFHGTETTYDPSHDWRSTIGFRSGKLIIIDTKQQPKIILSEALREFNISEIVDILPY